MFESANLEHHVDKATWKKEAPRLREALLNAQFDLSKDGRFPVLIVIGGVEGAGKGETVNLLNEWMDPRYIRTTAFGAPSDEELERPPMWRFWQVLPPRGRMGIFFGAWHSQPILERADGTIGEGRFEERIGEILRFERMLTDEGTLLLKLWFHLSKKQQKARLRELESNKKTRWRVGEDEWKLFERYDDLARVSERFLRATNTSNAPWYVIPGADREFRSLTVGRTLLEALRARLDAKPDAAPAKVHVVPTPPAVDRKNVLRALKLDQPLTKEDYEEQLEKWQGRLNLLSRHKRMRSLSVVLVFEGNDAAGKGGAIRRVTQALDARVYRGVPVAAPTEEERAQPYLWRFWRHIPRDGKWVIFDRSWYGRVLVERVEGYCAEADWMRAYTEINDFEAQLAAADIVVVKLWLAISKAEQLKRFQAREATSFKRFKITDEDWRNREKWGAYERAVCDMVDRTSTDVAPWTLVEANNKYFARLKVLKTVTRALEAAVER